MSQFMKIFHSELEAIKKEASKNTKNDVEMIGALACMVNSERKDRKKEKEASYKTIKELYTIINKYENHMMSNNLELPE